ncbi:uncharacterized protein CEXT_39521 [Caerostris extrusa]|uniref:Ciliary microtubule inner protein 2A-C-like domain-containing protein n=1 Tax=Caerostris extrusa TaxID=172846 RepID=A0AAV4R2Z2_CAEEX|nr:uncharacterized protein CEXT_39521 [Caerostris extrusa]
MDKSKEIKYEKNPFAIKDPYYLPGYTGHCPSYKGTVGTSYGRATHEIMEGLPSPPGRLKPVSLEDQTPEEIKELDIFESRKSEGKFVIAKDIAIGYKGHIPRARDVIGLSFNKSCIKSVAEFEKRSSTKKNS